MTPEQRELLNELRRRDPSTLDGEERRVVALAEKCDANRALFRGWLKEFRELHPEALTDKQREEIDAL